MLPIQALEEGQWQPWVEDWAGTYSDPSAIVPPTRAFFTLLICKCQTGTIGTARTNQSITKLITEFAQRNGTNSMHEPSS